MTDKIDLDQCGKDIDLASNRTSVPMLIEAVVRPLLARARELEVKVKGMQVDLNQAENTIERLKGLHNADKQHYLGIAQDAQSHAATLAGALELFINADPTWASDGDGVMEVTWIAFAKARAALAAWREAQGGDSNGDTDKAADNTG